MSLREDQIVRYSRHVLLKEVGGRGQQRLLSSGVLVEGDSPALDVAMAYLAASGTPVVVGTRSIGGFVDGQPLADFAPDALASPASVTGWLGPWARRPTDPARFRVALADGLVTAAPAGHEWLEVPDGVPAEPVALGSLAALLVQRFVLGLELEALAVQWTGDRFRRHAR